MSHRAKHLPSQPSGGQRNASPSRAVCDHRPSRGRAHGHLIEERRSGRDPAQELQEAPPSAWSHDPRYARNAERSITCSTDASWKKTPHAAAERWGERFHLGN